MRFKTNSVKKDLSGRVFVQIIDTEDKHSPIRKLVGTPDVVGEVVDWLNNGMKTDWKIKAYKGINELYDYDEILIDEYHGDIVITEIKDTKVVCNDIIKECDCKVKPFSVTDWKSVYILSKG